MLVNVRGTEAVCLCNPSGAATRGVEFQRDDGHRMFWCHECTQELLEEQEDELEDVTSDGQALEWAQGEAERFGMDLAALLRSSQLGRYLFLSPRLRKAIYFAMKDRNGQPDTH